MVRHSHSLVKVISGQRRCNVADNLSKEDQLLCLAVYGEACDYIRVGDAVAYTVISITYPTAFGLFGWAFVKLGGLWSGASFAVSLAALLWLLLGSAIFWQIHYKSKVRIDIAKRIEDALKLERIGARHLTDPGLYYNEQDDIKNDLRWREYRPWFIEGLSSVIRIYIPRFALFAWVAYAVLFAVRYSGKAAIDFSDWLTSDSVVFLFTLLIAASLATLGWRGCRSKRNQIKRYAQTLKCRNSQK